MRRWLLTAALAGLVVALTAQTAFAAGWWVEYGAGVSGDGRIIAPVDGTDGSTAVFDSRTATDPDGTGPGGSVPLGNLGQGNPNTSDGGATPSPHGDFSTTSNKCKTCHAVHGANDSSFRLLHDSGRTTECNWCHEASAGRSSHRPFGEMGLRGQVVRGEHTLGATRVPDSNVNTPCYPSETCQGDVINGKSWGRLPDRGDGGYGLNCYYCHTVHGSDRIEVTDGLDDRWKKAILRRDPAGNGVSRLSNNEPKIIDWKGTEQAAAFAGTLNYVKTAFCSDCHNKNPNWGDDSQILNGQAWNDTDNDGVKDPGETYAASRPNPAGHPSRGNGYVEIYGYTGNNANTRVSFGLDSCISCHQATTFTQAPERLPGGPSDFPHQSAGYKLLDDGYIDSPLSGVDGGDPYRPLPAMDQICLGCHGAFVGITF